MFSTFAVINTLIPSYLECQPQLLCYHKNATPLLQVVRINNVDQWYFERVVLPGEDVMFEAPPAAELEIYSGSSFTLPVKRILCASLEVRQAGHADDAAA
jgi:hypothetical protein